MCRRIIASRSVSRVLYGARPEGSARDGHSSGTIVTDRLEQSTRTTARRRVGSSLARPESDPVAPIRSCSRWGLPCRRRCRPRGALLPHPFTLARHRCRAGWSALCGAFPEVSLAGRYPAPCLRGARTFLRTEVRRPSDRLAEPALRGGDHDGKRASGGAGAAADDLTPIPVARRAPPSRKPPGSGRPPRDRRSPSSGCRRA